MTTLVHRPAPAEPFAPITATLRAAFGTAYPLPSLLPGLLAHRRPNDWISGADLIAGDALPTMLGAARRLWHAQPHAAAALAWKHYTYWVALPAVVGWAGARRVPLLRPADTLIRVDDSAPLLRVGLAPSTEVAVLPGDPLAAGGHPGVRVAADEADLLAMLRGSLLDEHLTPLLDRLRGHARVGARTLLGSLASGVAQGVLRTADVLPGRAVDSIETLLAALDVADLVDLVPEADGRLTVQRRTCCLAFTLPAPKVCSGCCIKQ
ncbi:hypothetical protein J2S43_007163 [Catenuloplanes nepalensis]|uniref:Aerobactin siderophore biosynthesis IucA/IucC-like C-terminal domain-containing protein n=1 Tax=Catenuloplanes nepalensis TaxID=587533 RepID=A0ABT9N5Y2_9ACTN|nr:hypothetical protein [Catenuloplanes nepalensis]MDP9798651.1 hypothetical protein [Catenuloplanes nepalensis]